MRRFPLPLLLALLLYLGFRALVLATNFDAVSIPIYELTNIGNLAHVVVGGWRGAPLQQYYDNCGGHLATGLLAVPFYALFGESYLILKLVPLLLGVAVMGLIWVVLSRWFDRRAAILAVFLFALGPPTLTKYSLLAKGNHFENLPFQLLCLATFYGLHSSSKKTVWILAHGLCAGFAIFFYFGSMALIALLALTHVAIRGPARGLRDFALALPAFLIGLAPLLWVHFTSGSRPGGFLESKFSGRARPPLSEVWQRIEGFFSDTLPRASVYEDLGSWSGSGRVADGLFLAVFALAWLVLAVRLVRDAMHVFSRKRSGSIASESERFLAFASAPLVLYLPLVVVIVGAGNIKFDAYGPPVEIGTYRYLVPHLLFAILVIAIASSWLLSAKNGLQRTAGGALTLGACVTTAFTLPLVDPSPSTAGAGLHYPGWSMHFYNNVLMRDAVVDPRSGRLDWDWEHLNEQIDEFEPTVRHELWFGAGYHAANALTLRAKRATTPPALDLDRLLRDIPVKARGDVAHGAGSWLREYVGRGETGLAFLESELERVVQNTDPHAAWVIEGLGMPFDFPLARATGPALRTTGELSGLVPAGFEWAWRRGLGRHCGALLARGFDQDRKRVQRVGSALPETQALDFWYGVGLGLSAGGAAHPRPEAALASVPAAWKTVVLQGYGAGMRHGLGAEACTELLSDLQSGLEPSQAEALVRGARWESYPRLQEL